MTFLCRTLGHKPGKKTIQRDIETFAPRACCARCGVTIVFERRGWQEEEAA